ncbi:uncharacterized protein C4orf17 homolog [Anser cygnoides]|nr:uncharacterized protein C4orf17 homolog [Anser cygnoides]XP_047922376.1 uncharacterized protein C4orf17 homolog [Anser cygnoides]
MNTILRLGCEPELNHSVPRNHRRYSDSSCAGGKYYFSRNIPHPRMVCHIPGLNNVPVCIVRNSVLQEQAHADGTAIPKREASQERVLSGNAAGSSLASSYLPRLEAVVQRAPGSSQSVTQNREGLADVPKRTQSNPTSPEKLLKKRSQTSAQPAAVQGAHESLTQPSSPFANLTHSPYVQENVNFIPSYLDREIKVLEKLSKVLQTDSLTEIQNWLLRASLKEKDLMSNLIYSELADKDVLNNQPPAMKEGAAENTNIHCLLKPHPPPWRGPEREMNNRPSTKESEASQNMKHEKDAERIIFSRLRNRCPAHADTLSPGKNLGQQRAGSGNKRESCFHTPPNNRHLPSRAVPPPHSH